MQSLYEPIYFFWLAFVRLALLFGAKRDRLVAGLRKGEAELRAEGRHDEANVMQRIIAKIEFKEPGEQ